MVVSGAVLTGAVPSSGAACCPDVYYCVTGVGIVAQSPGPAPAGTTGGPWATLAEAQRGCPPVDFTVGATNAGPCNPCPMTFPGAIWFNFGSKTGWVTALPNSVQMTLAPDAFGAAFGRVVGEVLVPLPPHCPPGAPTGGTACDTLKITFASGCPVDFAGQWRFSIGVSLQGGSAGCNYVVVSQTEDGPSWTVAGSHPDGWYRRFVCPTPSWPLASVESLGTFTLRCTSDPGVTASFCLTVSR